MTEFTNESVSIDIAEIDVNPVRVADGQAVALDGLIVLGGED